MSEIITGNTLPDQNNLNPTTTPNLNFNQPIVEPLATDQLAPSPIIQDQINPITPNTAPPVNPSPIMPAKKIPVKMIAIIGSIIMVIIIALTVTYKINTNWGNLVNLNFTPDKSEVYFSSSSYTERVPYSGKIKIINDSPLFAVKGQYIIQIRDKNTNLEPYLILQEGNFNIAKGESEFIDLDTKLPDISKERIDTRATGEEVVEVLIFSGGKLISSTITPIEFKLANPTRDLTASISTPGNLINVPKGDPMKFTVKIENKLDIPLTNFQYKVDMVAPGQTTNGEMVVGRKTIDLAPKEIKTISESYVFDWRPFQMGYDESHETELLLTVEPYNLGESLVTRSSIFTLKTMADPYK